MVYYRGLLRQNNYLYWFSVSWDDFPKERKENSEWDLELPTHFHRQLGFLEFFYFAKSYIYNLWHKHLMAFYTFCYTFFLSRSSSFRLVQSWKFSPSCLSCSYSVTERDSHTHCDRTWWSHTHWQNATVTHSVTERNITISFFLNSPYSWNLDKCAAQCNKKICI